ncbi:GntR family transcriptional regulator [Streptomyces halstedii]|uniref:GntR family transcriptional regulator n=1 Tax=Streptomyces halstedii TaxID=1944 RepID=A0A6N9U7K8_STRHA|nr:GntR family transcriptional regulator [Streptomyces halstedii]NEA19820.1 GntR family transcriptional regulator [Streptomyces halstedii]
MATPKYQQIADILRAAILAGTYGPGDRLPGENDLMTQHAVARMTVRQALGVLTAEGLAEPRKGAGVFVRARPKRIRRRAGARLARSVWGGGDSVWSADLDGRPLAVDRIDVGEEFARPDVAGLLGIATGDPVCVRRRRYLVDGSPVMWATSYLSAALVEGSLVTSAGTGPGGVYARLADLGHAPVHARETVQARAAAPDERALLGLSGAAVVVLVRRTVATAEGTVVEVADMVMDADVYLLEYDIPM